MSMRLRIGEHRAQVNSSRRGLGVAHHVPGWVDLQDRRAAGQLQQPEKKDQGAAAELEGHRAVLVRGDEAWPGDVQVDGLAGLHVGQTDLQRARDELAPSLKVVMNSLLTRTCRSTSKAQDPWMVKSSAGRPSRIGLSAAATPGASNAAATARPMTKMRRFMPSPNDRHERSSKRFRRLTLPPA